MGTITVRRGRAKPLWKGHPWIYKDSIARVEDTPEPGDLVTVQDADGRVIGCGFWSPESKIAVRLLSREAKIETGAAFFRERIAAAVRLRSETLSLPVYTDGYRLVHSEGDLLPGLIVDQFARFSVVQFSTAGMHRRRDDILDAIEAIVEPDAIFEQPDRAISRIEGIETRAGFVRGVAPKEPPSIMEHGVCFRIALGAGQKTGFFCDQRPNRQYLARLVRDRSVLDLFTYTGGFGLYAAANGATEVVGVDSSGGALAIAVENALLNNLIGAQLRFERGDAKDALNEMHRQSRRFDVVVCDPPKYARTRAGAPKALRAYRDLHLRALRVIRPGGLLATSSCSGVIADADFETTLRDAAHDVGRCVQIIHRGGQGADHPVLATCPESRYLKFLVASVA